MKLYEDPKISKYNSKLKKMRLMRTLTQDELSKISGVNIKSLSAYEQNPSKLNTASAATVYKLSNALNCEIEDLLNIETINEE
jgi:transcriptional regulator with XRE-family HTH domain